jgi:hypothetical protein
MKTLTKLTVILLTAVFLSGCATFDKMFPPPAELVCDRPEAAESVICKEFRAHGVEPEQVGNLILDSVAIAALVKPEAKAAIERFILKFRIAVAHSPVVNLAMMFTWIEQHEVEFKVIEGIFSRRLPWLKEVDEYITDYDHWLIEEHLKHIEELL